MVRPHLRLEHKCVVPPSWKLDPRYHPLGQPGPRYAIAPKICFKIPYGLRVPAIVLTECFIVWHLRHWLYPHGPRTVYNVRIPIHQEEQITSMWRERFNEQQDIYKFGHVYHAIQEERIREAKEAGTYPNPVPPSPIKKRPGETTIELPTQ